MASCGIKWQNFEHSTSIILIFNFLKVCVTWRHVVVFTQTQLLNFTIFDPTSPLDTRNKIKNFEYRNNPLLLREKQTTITLLSKNLMSAILCQT